MSTFALKKEQYIYNICKLVVTNILRYLWTLYIIEYRNSTKKEGMNYINLCLLCIHILLIK